MALLLPGYAGTVWLAIRASLAYANTHLNPNASPVETKGLARIVATTLKNGNNAICASLLYQGLQQIYVNLAPLVPLPLSLSAQTLNFMQNRLNALQMAVLSAQALQISVSPTMANSLLAAGNPAVADPGYLEWLMNSRFESPPPFLSVATLASEAQTEADAWTEIATALRQQGVKYSGATYNMVVLMGEQSQVVADNLNEGIVFNGDTDALWNQLVFMPTVTRCSDAIMNNPASASAQLITLARYITLQALNKFDVLIIALRNVVGAQVKLGTFRHGDTLLTFANRELGNFELWRQIAQMNGLNPPYVSPSPAPGLVSPGQQLFLPESNATVISAPLTEPTPSYLQNYLGVDKYLGPLNQPMLPWAGDYQIISGYSNLSISVGRRLQTALGSLIYHPAFGSRIPPEVGSIASNQAMGLIIAFAKSAILSDPRVNKIVSINGQLLGNYSIAISAVVLPNGLQQHEVTINQVIGPP